MTLGQTRFSVMAKFLGSVSKIQKKINLTLLVCHTHEERGERETIYNKVTLTSEMGDTLNKQTNERMNKCKYSSIYLCLSEKKNPYPSNFGLQKA